MESVLMSVKKKYIIEYEVKSSPKILFNFLSSPNGLAEWFAKRVEVKDGYYVFIWEGESERAKLLNIKDNKSVRFKWEDSEPYCYFEFEVMQDELTGDVALSITDFSTSEDQEEEIMIWNNRVEDLIRVLGA